MGGRRGREAGGWRRGFLRDRRGASAVEFALVAPVFLALTFSILEAGYFFFVEAAVEAANAKAARLIRTGQAQQTALSREAFFDEICDVVDVFGDCATQLTVDVTRYASFSALAADLAAPVCRDADPDDVDDLPYDAGAARDIVRVRVCYLHKSFNPGLGLNLQKTNAGALRMISTSIFRNEPYES
ncbi:MAG: TadE/TadG family type IV pilus assembly protein [Parvularculaceae bacterium]|nr:TadE/TadG family type IV pilus assembly protein [Parvularculaceae bacterium]